MENLFEIVFEDISIENIDSCLKRLNNFGENVSNYNLSSNDKNDVIIDFKKKMRLKIFC